jgi:PiT family inorganic phosphate transporter
LIGSIIGVGLANQLLAPTGSATSGVDWAQAVGVLKALLFSPLIGFVLAALMLSAMKLVVRSKSLYVTPEGRKPPPGPIRALWHRTRCARWARARQASTARIWPS